MPNCDTFQLPAVICEVKFKVSGQVQRLTILFTLHLCWISVSGSQCSLTPLVQFLVFFSWCRPWPSYKRVNSYCSIYHFWGLSSLAWIVPTAYSHSVGSRLTGCFRVDTPALELERAHPSVTKFPRREEGCANWIAPVFLKKRSCGKGQASSTCSLQSMRG